MVNSRWSVFGICVCLFLMSMFYRASNAIIAPQLSLDLNLNPKQLGLLGAVFFYAYAFTQFPLGLFLDRAGARRTMAILNLVGVIGTIIFAQAVNLTESVIGRALLGIGMSANFIGSLKLFTNWFDQREFATIAGLLASLGTLGSLAATTPLALLVTYLGWRASFYVLAGCNAIITVSLLIWVRDTPLNGPSLERNTQERVAPPSVFFSIKTLISSWDYWAISLTTFLRYGAFASIQALWAGPFLIQYLKVSTITAGNLLLLVSVGFILGSPAGGYLSDRILRSRKWAHVGGLSILAISILIISQWKSHGFLWQLGVTFFTMGFTSAFSQIGYAHIKELMPKEISGTAMAGINFFIMMGAGSFIHGLGGLIKSLSPSLSMDGEAYRIAFMVCFVAVVSGAILCATTRDSDLKGEIPA